MGEPKSRLLLACRHLYRFPGSVGSAALRSTFQTHSHSVEPIDFVGSRDTQTITPVGALLAKSQAMGLESRPVLVVRRLLLSTDGQCRCHSRRLGLLGARSSGTYTDPTRCLGNLITIQVQTTFVVSVAALWSTLLPWLTLWTLLLGLQPRRQGTGERLKTRNPHASESTPTSPTSYSTEAVPMTPFAHSDGLVSVNATTPLAEWERSGFD